MIINQFIFGSFEGIDGGHKVVASSSGISDKLIKELNQLQSRYIGDFQEDSPKTKHFIFTPLRSGGMVFAGFNFSGNDSHGRQGMIRMHGLVIDERGKKILDNNPFGIAHHIQLDDLEKRAEMNLDTISISLPILDVFYSEVRNKDLLNFLIDKIQKEENTTFPYLHEGSDDLVQLFNLLTPAERKNTTFVTYSNFSKKLSLTGTREPFRSLIHGYIGEDFVYNRKKKQSIETMTKSNQSDVTTWNTEIPVKVEKIRVGAIGILTSLILLIGIYVFALNFSFNNDNRPESLRKKDLQEVTNLKKDKMNGEAIRSNGSDRKYINQKAKPINKVNLREKPSENSKSLVKLTTENILDCKYCLTQKDTVQDGCSNPDTINEGYWCKVQIQKTELEGWVWQPCITFQK